MGTNGYTMITIAKPGRNYGLVHNDDSSTENGSNKIWYIMAYQYISVEYISMRGEIAHISTGYFSIRDTVY